MIAAALWVAIALPAALAYDIFYDVNERCYQQSLDDVLHDAGEGFATGCVPAVAFVILGAARYGPAVLLVPSADINRQAPFLSGLFFAALSALAFALAGRRAGLLITVAVILCLEFVLAGFLLVLWHLRSTARSMPPLPPNNSLKPTRRAALSGRLAWPAGMRDNHFESARFRRAA